MGIFTARLTAKTTTPHLSATSVTRKLGMSIRHDLTSVVTVQLAAKRKKERFLSHFGSSDDVHFDNPVFACLELDYAEADQDPSGQAALEAEKHLTYYELDLGLNHVIRRWSEAVSRTAFLLLAVPGGSDGRQHVQSMS